MESTIINLTMFMLNHPRKDALIRASHRAWKEIISKSKHKCDYRGRGGLVNILTALLGLFSGYFHGNQLGYILKLRKMFRLMLLICNHVTPHVLLMQIVPGGGSFLILES